MGYTPVGFADGNNHFNDDVMFITFCQVPHRDSMVCRRWLMQWWSAQREITTTRCRPSLKPLRRHLRSKSKGCVAEYGRSWFGKWSRNNIHKVVSARFWVWIHYVFLIKILSFDRFHYSVIIKSKEFFSILAFWFFCSIQFWLACSKSCQTIFVWSCCCRWCRTI